MFSIYDVEQQYVYPKIRFYYHLECFCNLLKIAFDFEIVNLSLQKMHKRRFISN